MTLEEILRVPTAASPEDRAEDVWDDENRCCYSSDGEKLLDAENFPPAVTVREGCRILCDEVFAFQDYMAQDRKIGEEIQMRDEQHEQVVRQLRDENDRLRARLNEMGVEE